MLEQSVQPVTEKDVVTQDETGRRSVKKILCQQKGLCQPFGAGLFDVGKRAAPTPAVTQKILEQGQVDGGGDDGDIPDARQHEDTEGIVDHGLVTDRHELFADAARQRIQARTRSAGKKDAFALLFHEGASFAKNGPAGPSSGTDAASGCCAKRQGGHSSPLPPCGIHGPGMTSPR